MAKREKYCNIETATILYTLRKLLYVRIYNSVMRCFINVYSMIMSIEDLIYHDYAKLAILRQIQIWSRELLSGY